MQKTALARGLKIVLALIAVCLLLFYGLALPWAADTILSYAPEYARFYWPWLCFLWVTAIPGFVIIGLCWNILTTFHHATCFTHQNGLRLRWVARLFSATVAYFFAGNLVFLLLGGNHWGLILAGLIIDFAGLAIALFAKTLSVLVDQAAALQEQSDLTI